MEELDVRIGQLIKEGLSLREIARRLDIWITCCRRRAIIHGFYQPKLKKVKDGKAVCLKCKREMPVSDFPQLASDGRYVCASCLADNLHKYQIKKVGCDERLYQELYDLQEGKCAICKKDHSHKSKNGVKAKLAVDHNHATGKIRGLLCGSCNRGLGYIGEENLAIALAYCQKC